MSTPIRAAMLIWVGIIKLIKSRSDRPPCKWRSFFSIIKTEICTLATIVRHHTVTGVYLLHLIEIERSYLL